MKNWKRLLIFVLCIGMVLSTNRGSLFAGSETQIEHTGENSSADGISVSKSVSGTDIENVFDITLKVETDTNVNKLYEKPPASVVVVLDISNTMFTGKNAYDEAMKSLKTFINTFYNDSRSAVVPRELAVVTFNTSAQTQLAMTDCSTTTKTAKNIYDEISAGITSTVGNRSSYATSNKRFTNIEAGLQLADNILKKSKTNNKFVILLTDGMPTTYSTNHSNTSTTSIAGYSPVSSRGNINNDGVFYSALAGQYCSAGTSYSDKGAKYAQERAAAMKKAGTKIYSVGINIGDTTIESLIKKGIQYVIDSRTKNTSKFVIKSSASNKYSSDYKNWLYHEIASDYYHDGNNESQMNNVYNDAFKDIVEVSKESLTTSWRISDPMNNEGLLSKNIEFLGFFNKSSSIVNTLSGSNSVGGENTAAFTASSERITWTIHESGYVTNTVGGKTTYCYELKYRIRLKNETSGFESNTAVPTNGKTTLSYVVNEDGKVKNGSVDFDIPKVKGYVGKFSFIKIDELNDTSLQGAQFKLVHSASCSSCNEIGKRVVISDKISVSGADGKVSFSDIPSGHEYVMTEIVSPSGYVTNLHEYEIVVKEGDVTVDGTAATSFISLGNTPREYKLTYVVVTPEADCPNDSETDATPPEKANILYNRNVTLENTLKTTSDKKGDIPGTWTFSGWYDNEECTGTPITEKNVKKDEKVYGKWDFVPTDYNVKYEVIPDPVYRVPDGVSVPTDTTDYAYKQLVEVKDNLTTSDTTAVGPKGEVNGTWVFVPWDKSDFNITEDTTITGKWIFEPDFTLEYIIVSTENPDEESTDKLPEKEVGIEENAIKALKPGLTTTADRKDGVTGDWEFKGWYYNEECTGTPITSITIEKNEKVYGKWEFVEKTHKVTYVVIPDSVYGTPTDTETPDDSKIYNHKERVDVKDNLTTSWTTSDGTDTGETGNWVFTPWDKDDFNITEDTTITGAWSFLPDYYLRYEIVSKENPDSKNTTPIPAPEKGIAPGTSKDIAEKLTTTATTNNGVPGDWSFKGWYDNKELEGKPVTGKIVIDENKTLYGRWDFEPYTYKVTYIVTGDPKYGTPKGGDAPTDGNIYDYEELVDVKDNLTTSWTTSNGTDTGVPGKWVFTPWDKNKDFNITEDTTIRGAWTFIPDTYEVKYEVKPDPVYGTPSNMIVPTDENVYNYKELVDVKADLTTKDDRATGLKGTVPGKWTFTPYTYKVEYKVIPDPIYKTSPTDAQIPTDTTVYDYKDLVDVKDNLTTSWTTSDGTDTGVPGEWVFTPWNKDDFDIIEDTTIRGAWTFTPYTYNLEYVIVSTDNPETEVTDATPADVTNIAYDTNLKLAAKLTTTDVEHNGEAGKWRFSGWYETSDCSGTPIDIKNIKKDEIVYGSWDFVPGAYTLNYVIVTTENPSEDKTDATPDTVEYIRHNTDENIAGVLETTDGFNKGVPGIWSFSGWYETPECQGTPVSIKNIKQDESVYGKWDFEPYTYTLEYEVVSTENPSEDKTDATPDMKTELAYDTNEKLSDNLTTTDKELNGVPGEWIFSGWYETEDFVGEPIDTKNIRKNEKVYGKWEFVPYTYTLDYVIVSTENPSKNKTDKTPDIKTEIPYDTDEKIADVLTTTDKELNGVPGEWIFKGWYEKSDCSGKTIDIKNIKQDEIVYGKWEFVADEVDEPETDKPDGDSAQTGDNAGTVMYIFLFIISAFVLVLSAIRGRKRTN